VSDAERQQLEAALGHGFADPELLDTALLHASRAHELDAGRGNERLEFLGDAVIGLVVAQLLYATHPGWTEGELTRARSMLVNREALAECGRRLQLGRHVQLGRTEQQSGGEAKARILANCFEAVVGALYLDAGLEPVVSLARHLFEDAIGREASRDPKTRLQEWAHARLRITPSYRTVGDSGVEEDEQRFAVEVWVGDEAWGRGVGRSKRTAERRAARDALRRALREDD
jgi:ribonuclease-3